MASLPSAQPRPGHIQRLDLVLCDEPHDDPRRIQRLRRLTHIDQDVRSFQQRAKIPRQSRPTAERLYIKDGGAIAVRHIQPGPRPIATLRKRNYRVLSINHAIFCHSIPSDPTATRKSSIECRVERTSIHSRFTAGDYFMESHSLIVSRTVQSEVPHLLGEKLNAERWRHFQIP